MHLVDIVLFAHIAVAIAAFGVAGVLHTAQWTSRRAGSTTTLKVWAPVVHRLEPLFPILALILFGLGAWLLALSDGEFGWGDGWVLTAIVGLALMEVVGGAVLAPRSKKALVAIHSAGDGPIDGAVADAFFDATLWAAGHFATGTAIGILFLMSTKPSGLVSVLIVALCALAGAAVGAAGAAGARRRTAVPAPAAPATT